MFKKVSLKLYWDKPIKKQHRFLTRQIRQHSNVYFMKLRSTPYRWMISSWCRNTLLSICTTIGCRISSTLFTRSGSGTIASNSFCCCCNNKSNFIYITFEYKLFMFEWQVKFAQQTNYFVQNLKKIFELIFFIFNIWKMWI